MSHFAKSVLLTMATQGAVFVFGMGVSIIVARGLGPEGKGIYSLAMLLPSFLVYFMNFGLGHSTVFQIGKKKFGLREIFGNNIVFAAGLGAAGLLLGAAVIAFFGRAAFPGVGRKFLWLALGTFPGQMLLGLTLVIFLGLQKFAKYNFILFFRGLVSFILIAAFLWILQGSISAAIFADICSFTLACGVVLVLLKKEIGGISFRVNKSYFRESTSRGLKYYTSSLVFFLQSQISIPLINAYLNPTMVGFYTLSQGLCDKVLLLPDAVGSVLFPKISSEADSVRVNDFTPIIFRNTVLLIAMISGVLFVGARIIITVLYSRVFLESVRPFRILLLGYIFVSGWKILENDFKGRGRPLINTYISGGCLLLNIVLNIFWLPKHGILGAAWAMTISYGLAVFIMLLIYKRVSGNPVFRMVVPQKSDIQLYKYLFQSQKKRLFGNRIP